MNGKTLYSILGVSEQATDRELKAALRKLSKENHPDEHPGDQALAERFKEISEAYSILSNPGKREDYDKQLKKTYTAFHKQEAESKKNQNSQDNKMSDIDFHNINKSFEQFFGFNPETKDIVNEDKLNPKRKNPLDAGELFEKFMGIKR